MRSISLGLLLGLTGCVLPSYQEDSHASAHDAGTKANKHDAGADDAAVLHGSACGLSAKLPSACDACIRDHCCDLAKACPAGSECGKDLLEPITPVADFSTDFDPLLGCMQDHCDDACNVNWGCVDNYHWPQAKDDVDVGMKVVDFAATPDKPLPDVEVLACEAVDPACNSGKVASAKTGADGMVDLKVPASFDGFFSLSGGGYVDSTVQWTEPVYREIEFKQLQLTQTDLSALAAIAGVHQKGNEPFKADAGFLIFRVQTCMPLRFLDAEQSPRAEAADVQVTFEPNDNASRIFYTEPNGGVSTTLDATTSDGVGGAFDVPVRNIAVHAVDKHSGKEVATGSVRIRAGAIGYAYLVARSLK